MLFNVLEFGVKKRENVANTNGYTQNVKFYRDISEFFTIKKRGVMQRDGVSRFYLTSSWKSNANVEESNNRRSRKLFRSKKTVFEGRMPSVC